MLALVDELSKDPSLVEQSIGYARSKAGKPQFSEWLVSAVALAFERYEAARGRLEHLPELAYGFREVVLEDLRANSSERRRSFIDSMGSARKFV